MSTTSSRDLSVLLLGSTGFLGGTVLKDLVKVGYQVTVLVRPGNKKLFSELPVRVCQGFYNDFVTVELLCGAADIVINAATSDDLELTKSINLGLEQGRHNGRRGVLVHISGTQVIESEPTGKLEGVTKYDDTNLEQIKGISEEALHRQIDLEVARADLSGEIIASIICPGVIFGIGTGPGRQNNPRTPFGGTIQRSLQTGRAVYAGEGTNVWPHVHVQDCSDLIILSLHHNLEQKSPAGLARFYFAENGEHSKLELAKQIGRVLNSKGLLPSAEPVSGPVEGEDSLWLANKTTSRCTGNRGRKELGWKPEIMLEASWEEEILQLAETIQREKK